MAGCRKARAAARPACGARKWPSCAASASPGTPGSNRAAKCRCRPRSGRASPACCSWRAPNAPICSSWPTAPIRSRRATTPAARQAAARLRGRDPRARLCAGPRLEPAGLERALARAVRRLAPARSRTHLLRYIFLDPAARELVVDWEQRARRVVAEFRADAGAHLDEPAVLALADALNRQSPVFAHWWTRHAVVEREGACANSSTRAAASWRSSRSPFDWPRIRPEAGDVAGRRRTGLSRRR